MDQRVQDMFSPSPRLLRGLVIVPCLTMMLAFPAAAQTNSDSETQGTGTVGVPAQPESERGPTSSNQVTPKTDSNSVTPSANSTTARPESKYVGTQRGSNPASKKLAQPSSSTLTKPNKK